MRVCSSYSELPLANMIEALPFSYTEFTIQARVFLIRVGYLFGFSCGLDSGCRGLRGVCHGVLGGKRNTSSILLKR